jgi:lipoprotein-releasing system ATP-binding protein
LRISGVLYFFSLLLHLVAILQTVVKGAMLVCPWKAVMNRSDQHILRVTGVYKSFAQGGKRLEVLRGVDAVFEQGKSYAITGVSGSGKSTFLQIIGGLDKPTHGDVFFDQKNLRSMRDKAAYLNTKIGFVFQFHYLIKELSVLDNIMLVGLIGGLDAVLAKQRALELLGLIGLEHKAAEFPMKLSGGEQQRVAIARALFNKPAFLIADEPTGSLDEANAANIVTLFEQFQREWRMGLIICTHDKAVYERMGSILRVHHGTLVVEKG